MFFQVTLLGTNVLTNFSVECCFPFMNRHNVFIQTTFQIRAVVTVFNIEWLLSFMNWCNVYLSVCFIFFPQNYEGTPSNPDAGNINVAIPNYDGSRNSFRCCICFCCPSHSVRMLFQFISHLVMLTMCKYFWFGRALSWCIWQMGGNSWFCSCPMHGTMLLLHLMLINQKTN